MIKNKEEIKQLIKEYKKTKSDIIFNKIYKILLPVIKRKVTYIYYRKWYPYNLYNPCKECKICYKSKKIPASEYNIICKECNKCTCNLLERGFFNLKENGLCRWEEVFNDLWMRIVRIIDNYDVTKDFDKYFVATLWEWRPSFLTKGFIKSIMTNKPLIYLNNEGDEKEEFGEEGELEKLNIQIQREKEIQERIKQVFEVCKTEIEKKVCQIYLENSKITEEEIGEKLGVTKQNISLILKNLRTRLE
jgi:hypothetical protein